MLRLKKSAEELSPEASLGRRSRTTKVGQKKEKSGKKRWKSTNAKRFGALS